MTQVGSSSNPLAELSPDPSIIKLSQQIIVESIVMLPVAQKPLAGSADQVPPGRVPSHETEACASWVQWNITRFPSELLSRIFGCLGCDAIVQVKGTCRKFYDVVQAEHREVFFYRQLPKPFRKKFLQSRSWQKRTVQNGLHPFTTELPSKESKILNTEQYAALLSFHTLRQMMFTSGYRAVEVFARACSLDFLPVEFSLTSSDMLLFQRRNGKLRLLSQSSSGSWSELEIGLKGFFDPVLAAKWNFSANGRYLSTFTTGNTTKILKLDLGHGRCQLTNLQRLKTSHTHALSPSGKCAAIYSTTEGIESIRCFDDQGQWVPMPMAKDDRIDPHIERVHFSPSDQHLAIVYRNKLVILSLDSQGCWNFSWASASDQRVGYTEFCPSGGRMLIAFYVRYPEVRGSVEMIMLDPTGEWRPEQRISSKYLMLTFSPGGKYLVSRDEHYLLWQLLNSGVWAFYGDLADPGAAPLPALGQTSVNLDTIMFSPGDDYLLISSRDGAVNIWGRDERGCWVVRGSAQHDGAVNFIRFSESGVHALTVDLSSMRIWGLGNDGLWSVKGKISATGVKFATFHPVAEHLVISLDSDNVRIWQVRKSVSAKGVGNSSLIKSTII